QLIIRSWFKVKPFAFLHYIIKMLCLGILVERSDDEGLCIEHILNAIADQIINRLHIQLFAQPFLHTVNKGYLSASLFVFLEQAGCLVKKTRTFQCDAHAVRECSNKAYIRVGKSVLAL